MASVDKVEDIAREAAARRGADDGERTLVLVSDDNFSDTQVTQFIALTVRTERG